jgi:hypothetical protein
MMIVVFLVMITIMIVPAVGIAVGRCQRAALQPPGKKEQSDVEQAAVARAIVCESWRPTVLEFDIFVTIGFARFKKQQGRLNSVGLPNGLFENPRRRFAPLSLQPNRAIEIRPRRRNSKRRQRRV